MVPVSLQSSPPSVSVVQEHPAPPTATVPHQPPTATPPLADVSPVLTDSHCSGSDNYCHTDHNTCGEPAPGTPTTPAATTNEPNTAASLTAPSRRPNSSLAPGSGTCSGGQCVCTPTTAQWGTATCKSPSSVQCGTNIPNATASCTYGYTATCSTISCTGTAPTRTCSGKGTYCSSGTCKNNSCTSVPKQCPADTSDISWKVGSHTCYGRRSVTSGGSNKKVTDSTGTVTGWARYSCSSGGSWHSSPYLKTCISSSGNNHCPEEYFRWQVGWSYCGGWLPLTSVGDSVTVSDIGLYHTGSATYTCTSDGSWSDPTNTTCSSTTGGNSCSATTISNCSLSATSNGGTSGSCASGYTGSCSYTCNSGTWGSPSSNSCTSSGGNSCSATTTSNCTLSATSHGGSSGTCASGYTGSCSYTCSNGSWTQSSNSCTSGPICQNVSCNESLTSSSCNGSGVRVCGDVIYNDAGHLLYRWSCCEPRTDYDYECPGFADPDDLTNESFDGTNCSVSYSKAACGDSGCSGGIAWGCRGDGTWMCVDSAFGTSYDSNNTWINCSRTANTGTYCCTNVTYSCSGDDKVKTYYTEDGQTNCGTEIETCGGGYTCYMDDGIARCKKEPGTGQ